MIRSDIIDKIHKKVTYDEFEEMLSEPSNINYIKVLTYCSKIDRRWYLGYVLRIRDEFHYLYSNYDIKVLANSFIGTFQNSFVPLEIGEKIKNLLYINTNIRVLLLEIKQEYLIIVINTRIDIVQRHEYSYDLIIEQYNLNLIN